MALTVNYGETKSVTGLGTLAQAGTNIRKITLTSTVTPYGSYPYKSDYGSIDVKMGSTVPLTLYIGASSSSSDTTYSIMSGSWTTGEVWMPFARGGGDAGVVQNIGCSIERGHFTADVTGCYGSSIESPNTAKYRHAVWVANPYHIHVDDIHYYVSDSIADSSVKSSFDSVTAGSDLGITIQASTPAMFVVDRIAVTIEYKDGSSQYYDLTTMAPVPSVVSIGGASTSEAIGTATVTFRRTGDLGFPASASYATTDGTALSGSDYTAMSGTVDFAIGEVSKTIQIPITNTPDDIEGSEYFYVKITGVDQGIDVGTAQATVTITSEVVTRTEDFDLRRNILRLDKPAGEGINDPGQGTQMDGREGQTIIIHGGCNGKGGYHIFLDPRPSRGPIYGDDTPGDFDDWRSVYQDGSTRVFMKEFIDDTHPEGHYELAVESCNSDGSWSRTEFNSPGLDTAFKGPGTKDLHISKNDGEITASVGWGTGTGWRETKSSGGDGGGVENTYVYVACPGPPVCVDQGFLGYIQGITAEGWVDPSHTMSGGTTPTGTTPSGATVEMVPGSSGTSTPDVIDTVVFDTYRLIAKTVNATTTEFVWDTKRTVSKTVEVEPIDTKRSIVYTDEVNFDTFRLICKTVNLIVIDFLWDTARTVCLTVEVEPLDTQRETSLTDWTSYDTSREVIGDIVAEIGFDTKRTIKSSDPSVTTYTVGFDTKRTIIGDSITIVTFDTKRTIIGEDKKSGIENYSVIFDTKRTITKSNDPVFIFDTKRSIKKEVTVYLDTKRFRNLQSIQTVRFDTKRRKPYTFWEIPEYDDYL